MPAVPFCAGPRPSALSCLPAALLPAGGCMPSSPPLSPQFSPTRHRHPGTGVTGAAICFPRAPPRHTVPECRRVFSPLRIKKKNFLRFYANNFLTTAPPVCYINSCPCHGYGGIAQLARACGSYPQCPRFKSRCRYHTGGMRPHPTGARQGSGPLVKWLRHGPFTAVTWVRVPYGSP